MLLKHTKVQNRNYVRKRNNYGEACIWRNVQAAILLLFTIPISLAGTMLVGSRRMRKTRHSKRACHRTRHSRGTWKRTETTFTYHGKRWFNPMYIRYNAVRTYEEGSVRSKFRFADFTSPVENHCRCRRWRQPSQGSPLLFKLSPVIVPLVLNFTPSPR